MTIGNPKVEATAVARDADAAAALAGAVRRAGFPARAATDLGEVLERAPLVLVIDPAGWADSCHAWLNGFEKRRAPPPGVLFVSEDPLVPHTAGPAFGYLPRRSADEELSHALPRLVQAAERFHSYWPTPLGIPQERDLRRVANALERATGLEIRSDRQAAFQGALRTRMVARLAPSLREYAGCLEDKHRGPLEMEILAGLITVGETHFWRYAGQFHALRTALLPSLVQRGRSGRLRLWSAGCASGEEAYSLAMACTESLGPGWEFEVVGTDIHRPSLARARAGEYRCRSLRNLPPALAKRYTVPTAKGATVCESLRPAVRFEHLNLGGKNLEAWALENGPFDVVFCRNTLIYFSRAASDRVVSTFESALAEGGGLFLGASETLCPRRAGLKLVRGLGSFYYVRELAGAGTHVPSVAESGDPAEGAVSALYEKGLSLLDGEDFAGAKDAFRSLLALTSDDARGHTGLALLLANEGREAEALGHLEKARSRGPELAETHYLLGLLEERSGRDAEALLHYRRALGTEPKFFMAYFNRAWILRRMGRTEAFREEMRQVLGILRTDPRAKPWLTGGLGAEALLELVAEALGEGEEEA